MGGALAAALLLALGVPSLAATLHFVPGNPVLFELQHGLDAGGASLERLARSRERGLEWVGFARGYTDLGLARYRIALAGEQRSPAIHLLAAREALEAGLSRGPANPYAWLRLAVVAGMLGEESRGDLVSMMLRTGPFERRLALPAIDETLHSWDSLTESDRGIALRWLRVAWEQDHRATLTAAARNGRGNALARSLAGRDSERMR